MTEIYKMMLKIRLCEEEFVSPILSGEIKCPVHLCSGQEAIAVGVCKALNNSDYIFGNHRSHGHFLAKGGLIQDLVSEVFCKANGGSRGKGGSMHLIDPDAGMMGSAPIVGGTISLAVGAALSAQIQKNKRVAVSFFGDGATNEGVLYESMNFAALKKLPVIFVCENNLYSTHMPIEECRPNAKIYKIAEPFDIKTKRVDGNDVLQVYDNTKIAVEACRKGNGPFFLECMTYRLCGHVGPNDNIQGLQTDIRKEEELENWKRKDPIINYENFLLESRIANADDIDGIKKEINQEVSCAFKNADECQYPTDRELLENVFAE